ncbi:MAG: NYN domain-containing protein [Actinomycetota bacterium]
MDNEEERIALFLDYENLAIGARESLHGLQFDLRPVLDALAERGRVIARKAYADWSYFDEDRRMLTRSHVELIEIPQRMGAVRKNAADIKLSVDALEMAFERDYITTFVICTGDSDFTPLVHKLRELNKRVIGVGIKDSTSALLPPACDEFLFYDTLEGVDVPVDRPRRKRASSKAGREPSPAEPEPEVADQDAVKPRNVDELAVLIAQTLAGLERSSSGPVLASSIKRALLRKDPTFSEAEYGFRAFGEMLRHLADRNVIELAEGSAKGDPEVSLPTYGGEKDAFDILRKVVSDLESRGGPPPLSGLKNKLRKVQPDFSEKKYGYRGFLQFVKAAETQGVVNLQWDDDAEDYIVAAAQGG